MAKYKNQHLVPQVYLKNFIKKSKNENSKYQKGIYVTDKEFSSWKEKSTNHNVFTKSYFYTLDKEDENNPIIEKYLSTLESQYTKTLKSILNKNISKEDILFITYFTLIQLMRVEKHSKHFQNSMDEISLMVKNIQGIDIDEETKDISKKMLLNFGDIKEDNIIYEQGVHLLENNSKLDFITSDSPVVRRMLHIDELQNIFNTIPLEYNDYLLNTELVLFFFPLTPKIALLATRFLKSEDNSIQYIDISSNIPILQLNLLSYKNAYKNIYSSTENPFGKELELEIKKSNTNYIGFWCKIYTSKNRYYFELEKYERIKKPNKIIEDLKIYINKSYNLENIINDFDLRSLSIYENNREVTHMKE